MSPPLPELPALPVLVLVLPASQPLELDLAAPQVPGCGPPENVEDATPSRARTTPSRRQTAAHGRASYPCRR